MINDSNRQVARELYRWAVIAEEARQTNADSLEVFEGAVDECVRDAKEAGLTQTEVEEILHKARSEAFSSEALELGVIG